MSDYISRINAKDDEISALLLQLQNAETKSSAPDRETQENEEIKQLNARIWELSHALSLNKQSLEEGKTKQEEQAKVAAEREHKLTAKISTILAEKKTLEIRMKQAEMELTAIKGRQQEEQLLQLHSQQQQQFQIQQQQQQHDATHGNLVAAQQALADSQTDARRLTAELQKLQVEHAATTRKLRQEQVKSTSMADALALVCCMPELVMTEKDVEHVL